MPLTSQGARAATGTLSAVTVTLDRREQILAIAAQMFAEKGVAATTVRAIGNAFGVPSGSLYHLFESKEQMVDEIISSYFEDLFDRYNSVLEVEAHPRARLENLLRASFHSIAAWPEACEIYRNDYKYLVSLPRFEYLEQTTQRVHETWLAVIEAGVAEGEFRADLDPGLFYRFSRDAIWQSARWYRPEGTHTIDEIADACISLLMCGFSRASA
jgi:AcrR family transcriptional regulator